MEVLAFSKTTLSIATTGVKTVVEMPGFEPGASYMRSKRSTAELHPQGVIEGSIKLAVFIECVFVVPSVSESYLTIFIFSI